MVQCAFPEGLSDSLYWPLMILLYEGLCHENLATFMSHAFGQRFWVAANDALLAGSSARPEPPNLEAVRQRLLACGYADWLETEDFGDAPDTQ